MIMMAVIYIFVNNWKWFNIPTYYQFMPIKILRNDLLIILLIEKTWIKNHHLVK